MISFVHSYWGASLLMIPILLHSPPIQAALLIVSRVAASIAGIWFLTLANVGFYRTHIPLPLRMILGVSGTAMMIPSEVVNASALLIGIISVAVSNRLAKKALIARS